MTDKIPEFKNVDLEGNINPDRIETNIHHGVEAVFDIGDDGLSKLEKIALGIDGLDPVDDEVAAPAKPPPSDAE